MGLIDRLRATVFPPAPTYTENFWPYLNFGGHSYPLTLNQTLTGTREEPDASFAGIVGWAYRSNAVVHACVDVRIKVFSEARFQFRRMRNGRPGDLFGTSALEILETPWPGGTTGDLLARMEQDAIFAGNAFVARVSAFHLSRLRPDWVTIVLGSKMEPTSAGGAIDALPIGYLYHPGGMYSGRDPIPLFPEQVAHYAPLPDPLATYRGMSPLAPIMREIAGDSAATSHKLKFFEQGATPNMIVSLDPAIQKAAFDQWVDVFKTKHEGLANAYKTMYLGAGAKVEVVGKDFQQLDFKATQGAGETRIAAAFGVPSVIVGLSEGMQGSSLNAGNYGQARRRFADGTMRPLWRNVSGSLARIIDVPGGSDLWVDDRDIAFLREDAKDIAEIQQVQAAAIRQLVDAGFEPDSVVAAITNDDFTRLSHTDLYSVQLQPPQPEGPEPEPEPDEAPPEELPDD